MGFVVVSVVAVVMAATASPASARRPSAPALVCGELPTVDVVLQSDLTCDTPFHFVGDATPVQIDLRGHTLTVPGDAGQCVAPGPCGAIAGAAAVRNGTVVGTLSDIGEITRVMVRGDVYLALGFSGSGGPATLEWSKVDHGMVKVWGSSVTISHNMIRGGIDLVSTNAAIRDLSVESNVVVGSPGAGIAAAPLPGNFPDDLSGVMSGNIIWGSNGAGIDLSGGLWNIGDLRIEHNVLVGNDGSGVRTGTTATGPPVVAGGPVTIGSNAAIFNRGHGIEAGWIAALPGTGVVDGGGNQAAMNGQQPGCVGVTCP